MVRVIVINILEWSSRFLRLLLLPEKPTEKAPAYHWRIPPIDVVSTHTTSIQSPSDLEIGHQIHSEGTEEMMLMLMWSFVCFEHLIQWDWEINKQIKTYKLHCLLFSKTTSVCALTLLFFIYGVLTIYAQTQSSFASHNFIELWFPGGKLFFWLHIYILREDRNQREGRATHGHLPPTR